MSGQCIKMSNIRLCNEALYSVYTEQYTDVYTTSFDVGRVWECFTLAINSRLIIIHD